ncbi:MAG: DUF2490 domain-containing protein [Leadbetterella sp.]
MKKGLIIASIFISFHTFSQQGTELWSSVGVSKGIGKKFDAGVQFQTRFVEDISYLRTYFLDATVNYEIIKNLDFTVGYRYFNRRKNIDKDFKNRQRYYADLSHGFKFEKFKISNRIRYQHQFVDDAEELVFDASYLRYKLQAAYNTKSRFTPYVSGDLFYNLKEGFDQIRPKAGVDIKVTKIHRIDIGFQTDISFDGSQVVNPVINIGYKAKLK